MFKRPPREDEEPSYLNLYGEELDLPFFFRYQFPLLFFSDLPLKEKYTLPLPTLSQQKARHEVRMGWSWEGISCRISYPKKEFRPDLEGDAIELFFDTRDQKEAPYPNRFCHHFLIFPEPVAGQKGREVTRFRGDETHPYADPSLFDVHLKEEKGVTWIDIFLPREAFCGYDPGQFERLGWSYRILMEGSLPQQLIPVKEIASLPSLWATLLLQKP
jgi:hypothetical protein